MSFLLTKEIASKAVDLVLPAITSMLEDSRAHPTRTSDLAIVIFDPTVPFSPWTLTESAILYRRSIGDPTKWEHPFGEIATAKAAVSWRTGLPSHQAQQIYPHLFKERDTPLGGSWVFMGIPVGCSAVKWWFDELFSAWIGAACYALCKEDMQTVELPADRNFLIRQQPGN